MSKNLEFLQAVIKLERRKLYKQQIKIFPILGGFGLITED